MVGVNPIEIYTGTTEPLIVQALNKNILSKIAYSPNNPDDIISYDYDDADILDDNNYIGAYEEDGVFYNDGGNMSNITTTSFDLDFKPILDIDGNGYVYAEWDTHYIYIEKTGYETDTISWVSEPTLNNKYTLVELSGGQWRVTFIHPGLDLLDPTYNYAESYTLENITSKPGTIVYRHNITQNIKVNGDFREIKNRRYHINVALWNNSTSYTKGTAVIYSNMLYVSMMDNNLNYTPNSFTSKWVSMSYIGSSNSYYISATSIILPNDSSIPIDLSNYKDYYMLGGNSFNLSNYKNLIINDNSKIATELDIVLLNNCTNTTFINSSNITIINIVNNCEFNSVETTFFTNQMTFNKFYKIKNSIIGKLTNSNIIDSYQFIKRHDSELDNTQIYMINHSILNIEGTNNTFKSKQAFGQIKYIYISGNFVDNLFSASMNNVDIGTTCSTTYNQTEITNNIIDRTFNYVKIIGYGSNENNTTTLFFNNNKILEYTINLIISSNKFLNNIFTTRIQGSSISSRCKLKSINFKNNKFLGTFNESVNIQLNTNDFNNNELYKNVYGNTLLEGIFISNIIKDDMSNNITGSATIIKNNDFNKFSNNNILNTIANNSCNDFNNNIVQSGSIYNNKGTGNINDNNIISGNIVNNNFISYISNNIMISGGTFQENNLVVINDNLVEKVYIKLNNGNRFERNKIYGVGVFEKNNIISKFENCEITINNKFSNNNIIGDFDNFTANINYFINNDILSNFQNCTLDSRGDFMNNRINNDVISLDFTSAVHVQKSYACNISLNSNNVLYLNYFNGSNVQTFVSPIA